MLCPYCAYEESKVVDSRSTIDGKRVRRRRECLQCGRRFTTYEAVETVPLVVVKRDESREPFDREKLVGRLMRACGKRPVATETLERAVTEIENELAMRADREVSSSRVAELAMQKLKDIDIVAYIRFVSVYREFSSIDEFMDELKKLEHRDA